MLALISPAKNLDFESPLPSKLHSKPTMLKHAQVLVDQLKGLAPQDICSLMKLSDKLGQLNYDRYQAWKKPFTVKNARPAVFAFNGDVYAGLDAYSLSDEALNFAQDRLRILSGLYGVLRPLDLMQAYRLEMGTKLANERGRDLYAFWGGLITGQLNAQLKALSEDTVVNLASNEYFKAVNQSELAAEVITPVFKDLKNGQYKVLSFFAKKARGRMCAYIINKQITQASKLKRFNWDGYRFNAELSKAREWVFTRDEPA